MLTINVTRSQYVKIRKRFGITCRGPKPGMVHIYNIDAEHGQIQFSNFGSNGINKTNHSITWQEDAYRTTVAIAHIFKLATTDFLAKARKL